MPYRTRLTSALYGMAMALVAIAIGVLLSVGSIAHAAGPDPTVRAMLDLKVEIQNLKDQLQASRMQAAQCDANWASTRAALATAELHALDTENREEKAALVHAVQAAGWSVSGDSGALVIASPPAK